MLLHVLGRERCKLQFSPCSERVLSWHLILELSKVAQIWKGDKRNLPLYDFTVKEKMDRDKRSSKMHWKYKAERMGQEASRLHLPSQETLLSRHYFAIWAVFLNYKSTPGFWGEMSCHLAQLYGSSQGRRGRAGRELSTPAWPLLLFTQCSRQPGAQQVSSCTDGGVDAVWGRPSTK